MFLIANSLGALMLLIALAVMLIVLVIFKYHVPFPIFHLACITLIVVDLGVRLYRRRTNKWLYENASGGNLFFLPVWVFGLVILVINIVRYRLR